jgi:hypothetical protein
LQFSVLDQEHQRTEDAPRSPLVLIFNCLLKIQWRRGWESNLTGALRTPKLLILRNAKYAKNAQNAEVGYTAGTEPSKFSVSIFLGTQICLAIQTLPKREQGSDLDGTQPANGGPTVQENLFERLSFKLLIGFQGPR